MLSGRPASRPRGVPATSLPRHAHQTSEHASSSRDQGSAEAKLIYVLDQMSDTACSPHSSTPNTWTSHPRLERHGRSRNPKCPLSDPPEYPTSGCLMSSIPSKLVGHGCRYSVYTHLPAPSSLLLLCDYSSSKSPPPATSESVIHAVPPSVWNRNGWLRGAAERATHSSQDRPLTASSSSSVIR